MDLPGAEGSRGQDGPVEDEVGGPQQQRAVLGARGLALGRVDDDDRAAPAPARRRELAGQRESGTAATPHLRVLDEPDEGGEVDPGECAVTVAMRLLGGAVGDVAQEEGPRSDPR